MRRGVTGVIAGAALLSALGAGGSAWREHQQAAELDRGARAAADGFAGAWARRALATASYVGSTPSQVAAGFAAATQGLGPVPVSVRVTSVDRSSGREARATLQVSWQLVASTPASAGTTPAAWRYIEPVALRRLPGKDRWDVVANGATSLWHPQLRPGSALVARRTWGTRGAIEDRSGTPLLQVGTVHDVQLDPVRATTAAASALEQIVGEPHGSLAKRLTAAQKASNRAPIPVITYRAADFAAVRKRLAGLTGVIYPSRLAPLAASRLFAQPLLGTYGAVTADTVKRGAGRYVAGDYAGLSGLQGRYDARLGGTPGVTVTTTGAATKTLFEQPPRNGAAVRLTLDTRTQKAAEAALTRTGSVPSALVALDVRSGDLLAVADSPAFGFERALQGRYAPGSTLKVATTYSLLSSGGLSPSTPVSCPPTVIVDGLRIRNFEGERLGAVPFSADFANSCNTAFAGLSRSMGNGDVHAAALALGVGAGWGRHLGVAGAFAGSVPPATSATERAASAFGQGRTLASPASLAVMAGSVARGSYVEPALVSSPGVPGADRTPRPLRSTPAAQLRSLMRLVVTSGTARRAFAGLGGAPVFGKTGTAEFGNASPPETRAWFVGWRGDVAFAVLVERGRSGGAAAAPVARDFLQRLR